MLQHSLFIILNQYKLKLAQFYSIIITKQFMASVIQSVIQKYKTEIEQQVRQPPTSHKEKMAALRLNRVAESFMSVIVFLLCSEEKLSSLTEKEVQRQVNELLDLGSQSKKIGYGQMKKSIGKFITDEFSSNPAFNGLQEQFQLLYEQESQPYLSHQPDSSLCIDEEEEFQQFLNNFKQQEGKKTKQQFDLSTFPVMEKQLFCDMDQYSKKVMIHIMDISSPQTELTYLCQSMGWKLTFLEKFDKGNQFLMSASVDFEFKKAKMTLVESYTANQKRIGKLVASFKMLRRIYLSFPQIWDLYDEKRSKKALVVEKSPLNLVKSVPIEILNEKIQLIPTKYERDESFLRDKDLQMNSISSFKSQMNLLNQHNPDVFNLKFDKMKVDSNMWKVKGELYIKYKGKEDLIQSVEKHLNSKTAEEIVVKNLIGKVYDTYIDIFQKMRSIKAKKNIKT